MIDDVAEPDGPIRLAELANQSLPRSHIARYERRGVDDRDAQTSARRTFTALMMAQRFGFAESCQRRLIRILEGAVGEQPVTTEWD